MNDKIYKSQPMSKTQPWKASDPSKGDNSGYKRTDANDVNDNSAHDFATKSKSTKLGSDYHEPGRRNSGQLGNFSEKESTINYLLERNRKGIEVQHHGGGGNQQDKHYTNGFGSTAYNNAPINEVYKPATSHGVPPGKAVIRGYAEKPEAQNPKDQKNITKKVK